MKKKINITKVQMINVNKEVKQPIKKIILI